MEILQIYFLYTTDLLGSLREYKRTHYMTEEFTNAVRSCLMNEARKIFTKLHN